MPETGTRCEMVDDRGWCAGRGRSEFCGYCAHCWSGLDPDRRRSVEEYYIADGSTNERVRTIYPARTRLTKAVLLLWRFSVASGLGFLLWERLK